MSIKINSNFAPGSPEHIDARQYLSFEEMRNIDEAIYPEEYIAIHKGTGDLYTFSKKNTINEETGKFRKTFIDGFPMIIFGGDAENENTSLDGDQTP